MQWSDWSTFAASLVQYEIDDFGVYELGDENKSAVYYGSGKVKTRLLDHLYKKECPLARFYRRQYTLTEEQCRKNEAQLLTEYKNAHGKLPVYNERIG